MLTLAQLIRAVAFCLFTGGVFIAAAVWILERLSRRPAMTRFARAFRSSRVGLPLVGIATAGLACTVYGFTLAPRQLTTTFYEVRSPKLPAGTRIRLVHLADLHSRGTGPRERALPELVRRLAPDLILHTGDFFSRREGSERAVADLLAAWQVPQFACIGNMDRLGDVLGVLQRAGVRLLNREAVPVTVKGVTIQIAGFPSGGESGMKRVLDKAAPDLFTVVLYHHPEGFIQTWDTSADLMLAGHTHGGQVRLPGYGALVTMDRFDKRWESGRYDEGGATLIVSRGTGCEPNAPEVRFWCSPEVVVVDLVNE